MSRTISERRLVDVLVSFFRETHSVAREVPHYEKRIDLATYDPVSNELWAIEAKTKNWPDAIAQAIVNLAVAHRSYVAIYDANVHRVQPDLLNAYGIGLIAVGTKWGNVEVIKEALPSRYQNRQAASRMIASVFEGPT